MFGFSIKEILPHIYHLHFESAYDLAMHFVRFQEYYESPKFYRKIFTLVDYMEWYASENKGAFTYPTDWSGFNVPSWVLKQVRKAGIPDLNKYDQRMFTLIDWVEEREFPGNYYFIGTSTEGGKDEESEEDVLDHEVAHALYATNPDYREEVNALLHNWIQGPGHKGEEYDSAVDVIGSIMGYHETTIPDEIHAYCATGLCDELEGVICKKEMKPFQKLFKEFKKRCMNEE